MEHTEEQEKSLWEQVLEQYAQQDNSVVTRNLLVLGQRGSGKSSVVAKLKGDAAPSVSLPGFGLEYTYMDVPEEETGDIVARSNIWVLEGDEDHRHLLKFALSEKNLPSSVAIVCLDFSRPWTLESSLLKWLELLEDHINSLSPTDLGLKDRLRKHSIASYQSYKEPEENAAAPKREIPSRAFLMAYMHEPDKELLPLDDDVLSHSLGIPVIVAVCKTDLVDYLKKEYDYRDTHFSFISQRLRRICMKYGASLLYCAAKKNLNSNVLQELVEKALFGFTMTFGPQLSEKETLFIPAGWDSPDKLAIENVDAQEPGTLVDFNSVISKPAQTVNEEASEEEIVADEEQNFLIRNYRSSESSAATPLSSPAKTATPSSAHIRSSLRNLATPEEKSRTPNTPGATTPLRTPTPTTPTSLPSKASDHQVLADFFNSLLQGSPARKSPSSTASPSLNNLSQRASKSPTQSS